MKITEIFQSLQGEGINIGRPTTFIRLTGCNLRCKWCDTQYAYDEGTEMSIADIIEKVKSFPSDLICITGGEPLSQPETNELVNELLKLGHKIDLETNGSINIEKSLINHRKIFISMDIKCPSTQMTDKMDFSNMGLLKPADQLKFVIEDLDDYEYAKKVLNEHQPKCNIILTPVDGIELEWLVENVLEDNSWFEELGLSVRILPQLHKLIWGTEQAK